MIDVTIERVEQIATGDWKVVTTYRCRAEMIKTSVKRHEVLVTGLPGGGTYQFSATHGWALHGEKMRVSLDSMVALHQSAKRLGLHPQLLRWRDEPLRGRGGRAKRLDGTPRRVRVHPKQLSMFPED